MKKSNLIILIIALCMFVSGIFVCVGALSMKGMDFDTMFKDNSTVRTVTYDEAFLSVDAQVKAGNLEIFPTSEDELKIECTEPENTHYDIKFEGNTLVIRRIDNKDWHQYFMNFSREGIKIYLPERAYEDIKLDVSSGKIIVNDGLSWRNLIAESRSGSVRAYGVTAQEKMSLKATSGQVSSNTVKAENMEVSCTSGRVTLGNVVLTGKLDVENTSGSIEVIDVNCLSLSVNNTSGGITCSGVIAQDAITAKTSSGSIELLQSDADNLNVKTTSGSIRGTLLSDKIFIAESTSGSVRVPQTTQGGICKVKTTSGSIDIKIV